MALISPTIASVTSITDACSSSSRGPKTYSDYEGLREYLHTCIYVYIYTQRSASSRLGEGNPPPARRTPWI